jgi:hypothetical protein
MPRSTVTAARRRVLDRGLPDRHNPRRDGSGPFSSLSFDPRTFAGAQGVFVDAKGGAAMPEPRLGWTRVGDYKSRS